MRKTKNSKRFIKYIFIIIPSILIGGIGTLLLFMPYIYKENILINSQNSKMITNIYEKNSLSNSVKKIYDAVVCIESYKSESTNGTGTGFFYKTDNQYGYILTNEHVISKSESVKIITSDDKEINAEILGSDVYLDLAVLRVDKKYVKQIAIMGNNTEMNIGDTVFTIGSPLGYDYRGTVTAGVLSGKDRMVKTTIDNNNDWLMKVLQIDASINPGNSGGPLLNVNGEVIGICTLKLVDNNIEGMGFAIPIEYAISHLESLENKENIKWPTLGITMCDITERATISTNNIAIPLDITTGAVIISIREGSNADKSSLQKGDIITKINNNKIKDVTYLKYELYQYKIGDIIEITYLRNNQERTTKVKLRSSD